MLSFHPLRSYSSLTNGQRSYSSLTNGQRSYSSLPNGQTLSYLKRKKKKKHVIVKYNNKPSCLVRKQIESFIQN